MERFDATALWGELSNMKRDSCALVPQVHKHNRSNTLQFCICLPWFLCLFPLTHLNKLDFLYPYQPWKLNVSFSFLTKMCQLWIPMVIACHTSKRYTLQQSFAILGSEVNLSDSCFTALRIMVFSLHQCNI